MATAQQRAGDPNAGRWVVITAGTLGLAAVVGYGFMQAEDRNRAQAAAQQIHSDPGAGAPTPIPELVTQAREARNGLDTAALSRMEGELALAAAGTTVGSEALEANRERLSVLSTLAVEASVRGAVLDDPQAWQRATDYAAQARALAEQLDEQLDPGVARATQARLTLASGGDVLAHHPDVLLPAFRDRELRHAVLVQALWTSEPEPEPDADAPDAEQPAEDPNIESGAELVRSLEQLADPSGLEQALLALALHSTGKTERAQATVDSLLDRVPEQPLALAVRDQLRKGALVAVADASPIPGSDPDFPLVEPEPDSEPDLVIDPEPTPSDSAPDSGSDPEPDLIIDPEPTPSDSEPDLVIDPEPDSEPDLIIDPEPAEPTKPAKPATKPATKPTRPKNTAGGTRPNSGSGRRKTPNELTDEGCKLVRSGDAKKGFSLLQKAFDLNPRDTRVTLCMSEGHMKLGRLPSARAMAERVLNKSPRHKKALLLAAKIENKLGNKKAAVNYYRRVLEIDPGNSTAQTYVANNG